MPSLAAAAFNRPVLGARAMALGGAITELADDVDTVLQNPAGLPHMGKYVVSASYARLFGIQELRDVIMGFVLPAGPVSFGIAHNALGTDLFRETTTAVSAGGRLTRSLSMGVSGRILALEADGYGTIRQYILDGSLLVLLPGGIRTGILYQDILHSKLGRTGSLSDRAIAFGVSKSTKRLLVSVQADVIDNRISVTRIGQEVSVNESLAVRFGVTTEPSMFFAGTGVTVGRIESSYAVSSHPALGLTHRVSVSLVLSG